jgi:hypothetical protein
VEAFPGYALRISALSQPHPETLIKGPVKKIDELVKEWFSIVGPGGGHGFYTSVLAGTPSEHVSAFVEAIKSCRYPIGS